MSKFCTTCGASLDDNALFCTTCGATLSAAPAAANEPAPATDFTPAPEAPRAKPAFKLDKKIILMAVAGVVVIALIIGLCSTLFAHPYKSAIENFYAIRYGNFEKFSEIYPQEIWDYLEEEYDKDVKDYQDAAEDSYDDSNYEDKYGKDVTIKVEIVKAVDLPKGQVEKIAEYLDKQYELDEKLVKGAKKVIFSYTISSDVYTNYIIETYVYVIQIGNKWYVADDLSYNSSKDYWVADLGW